MRKLEMSHDDNVTVFKLIGVWIATFVSSVSLQHVLMFITIIYTLLQVYVLVRDKIVRPRREERNRAAQTSD